MEAVLKSFFDFGILPPRTAASPLLQLATHDYWGAPNSAANRSKEPTGEDGEEDEEMLCMRSTELTWLEKYWENVKQGRRYPWMKTQETPAPSKTTTPREEFPSSSWSKRVKTNATIGSITLSDFVKEEQVRKDCFTVHFRTTDGLGLRWYMSATGRVLVQKIVSGNSGNSSVAQAGQQIEPGDELIVASGKRIQLMDDLSILRLLHSLDEMAKNGTISLTFQYTQSDDKDVIEMYEVSRQAAPLQAIHLSSEIQQAIRNRHMYPSAARVTCIDSAQDLQALAEDIACQAQRLPQQTFSNYFHNDPSPLLAAPDWLPQTSHLLLSASSAVTETQLHSLLSALTSYLQALPAVPETSPSSPQALPSPSSSSSSFPSSMPWMASTSTESRSMRAPSGTITRTAYLLSEPSYQRAYRQHFIPLSHGKIVSLLLLPWPEMVKTLQDQILHVYQERGVPYPSPSSLPSASSGKEDMAVSSLYRDWSVLEGLTPSVACPCEIRAWSVLYPDLSISLPPMDLTYALFYCILEQRDVVLQSSHLFDLLEQWMTTFNPTTWTALWQSLLLHPHHHSGAEEETGRLRLFFARDLSTATDCQAYLEIVTELVTLWMIHRCHAVERLELRRDHQPPSPRPRPGRGSPSALFDKKEGFACQPFRHLPLLFQTLLPEEQYVLEQQSPSLSSFLDLDRPLSQWMDKVWPCVHLDALFLLFSLNQWTLACSTILSLVQGQLDRSHLSSPVSPTQGRRKERHHSHRRGHRSAPKRFLSAVHVHGPLAWTARGEPALRPATTSHRRSHGHGPHAFSFSPADAVGTPPSEALLLSKPETSQSALFQTEASGFLEAMMVGLGIPSTAASVEGWYTTTDDEKEDGQALRREASLLEGVPRQRLVWEQDLAHVSMESLPPLHSAAHFSAAAATAVVPLPFPRKSPSKPPPPPPPSLLSQQSAPASSPPSPSKGEDGAGPIDHPAQWLSLFQSLYLRSSLPPSWQVLTALLSLRRMVLEGAGLSFAGRLLLEAFPSLASPWLVKLVMLGDKPPPRWPLSSSSSSRRPAREAASPSVWVFYTDYLVSLLRERPQAGLLPGRPLFSYPSLCLPPLPSSSACLSSPCCPGRLSPHSPCSLFPSPTLSENAAPTPSSSSSSPFSSPSQSGGLDDGLATRPVTLVNECLEGLLFQAAVRQAPRTAWISSLLREGGDASASSASLDHLHACVVCLHYGEVAVALRLLSRLWFSPLSSQDKDVVEGLLMASFHCIGRELLQHSDKGSVHLEGYLCLLSSLCTGQEDGLEQVLRPFFLHPMHRLVQEREEMQTQLMARRLASMVCKVFGDWPGERPGRLALRLLSELPVLMALLDPAFFVEEDRL